MSKIHTRLKRRFNLSHNKKHTLKDKTKNKPKTFKTEEAAKKYAEKNKITNYELINLKSPESSSKKIKIITK
ncbi:MAG: hypothetical protein ISS82_02905 [Nanoarchaeota archaeon]|nr:hypothetical protein [Nanoarchaeota archaeon]